MPALATQAAGGFPPLRPCSCARAAVCMRSMQGQKQQAETAMMQQQAVYQAAAARVVKLTEAGALAAHPLRPSNMHYWGTHIFAAASPAYSALELPTF